MHFTGLMDDVRPALAAFDASLFLARYDSFGLASCEAMASGVKRIAISLSRAHCSPPQYSVYGEPELWTVHRSEREAPTMAADFSAWARLLSGGTVRAM